MPAEEADLGGETRLDDEEEEGMEVTAARSPCASVPNGTDHHPIATGRLSEEEEICDEGERGTEKMDTSDDRVGLSLAGDDSLKQPTSSGSIQKEEDEKAKSPQAITPLQDESTVASKIDEIGNDETASDKMAPSLPEKIEEDGVPVEKVSNAPESASVTARIKDEAPDVSDRM